jgi:hypothetical protein
MKDNFFEQNIVFQKVETGVLNVDLVKKNSMMSQNLAKKNSMMSQKDNEVPEVVDIYNHTNTMLSSFGKQSKSLHGSNKYSPQRNKRVQVFAGAHDTLSNLI